MRVVRPVSPEVALPLVECVFRSMLLYVPAGLGEENRRLGPFVVGVVRV
jgi:hypothetical protein